MDKTDLVRLSRRDLLEMLLDLSKENEQLREKNSELEERLEKNMLVNSTAGSLAEAALQLNGVFEAAQAACDQYIEAAKQRCQKMEEEMKAKCDRMYDETRCIVELYMEVYGKQDYE